MRAEKVESLISLEEPVRRKQSDDQGTGRKSINKNDLVVLGLVFEEDRYGYQIIQEVRRRKLDHWARFNSASLYNHLAKLEESGALSSHMEKVANRPTRKMYSLTEGGRKQLSDMVVQALSFPPHGEHLELLGLSFIHGADQKAALQSIQARIATLQGAIKHLTKRMDRSSQHTPLNCVLLLEAAIAHMKADLGLFRRVKEAIVSGALQQSFKRMRAESAE